MINYNIENNLVYIEASGKLTYEDFKEILPAGDEVIGKNEKPKFFIKLKDFQGWEPSAMREELKYDIKHRSDYGPMAFVGESNTQKWLTRFSSLFFPAEIKYFDKQKENRARNWIESKSGSINRVSPYFPFQ